MSAALQLPVVWGAASAEIAWTQITKKRQQSTAAKKAAAAPRPGIDPGLAFYRKHTEGMLRRYMYASMLIGRTPGMLSDTVGRGFVSNRRVRTFEDAVIFVLDVESCLNKLKPLDRLLLSRMVLQEYTQSETAEMLGVAARTVVYKFPRALDRLTRLLLDAGLLVISH